MPIDGKTATGSRSAHIEVWRDVMVPMRDGIMLASDIYLPPGGVEKPGGFPVILERTPYDKNAPSRSELQAGTTEPMEREAVAEYFVRHGYAVIYQDCRGRYNSEGIFTKYVNESADGYDTCAWIVAQPWCNGRIGTKGLSYAAHTQAALASLNAPGVCAMFLDSGGFSNAYQGGIRQGGAFELKQVTWAVKAAVESPTVVAHPEALAALSAIDIAEWMERVLDWRPGYSPLSAAPDYEKYLFDQWRHGNFDEYWRQPGLYAKGYYHDFPAAATVHMSSWYDAYSRTATDNYIGLKKLNRNPTCLILGPWTHGNRSFTYSGDVDFGPAAALENSLAIDFLSLRLQWFDIWLKNATRQANDAAVHLFVMGGGSGRKNADGRLEHGGSWRVERDWPLPDTRWTPYYLHKDGLLSQESADQGEGSRTYRHDPRNPVPTIGGAITSAEPLMYGGAFDQCEGPKVFGAQMPYLALAERPDVLVFQTLPLQEDVEITGPVTAKFWVSSDCQDTDFNFKLIDVYPPNEDYPHGFAMNLTDGVLRARYRESWENPTLMEPGKIYQIRIDAFPTSNLVKRGHRIRIDVSSSNFPRFDINPNTGEPEGSTINCKIATNTIHLDATHASHVILPIISRCEN
ncbi:MAG TPA: CocE/NonD family hydrolase [Methylobacter sp.]